MNNNLRKGMTITELAVSIVIIGVVLSMVLKGKSILDLSRLKADFAVINKVQVAAIAYSTNVTEILNDFTENNLIKNQYIQDIDLNMKYARTRVLVRGFKVVGNYYSIENTEARMAGIIFGSEVKDNEFGCMADEALDDMSDTTGYARTYNTAGDGVIRTVKDCVRTNKQGKQTGFRVY